MSPAIGQSLTFNQERGFYTTPLNVELATDLLGATIKYTTDFSEPSTTNGVLYTGPLTISQTTTVRAIAYSSLDTLASVSHSYLYLADIEAQNTLNSWMTQHQVWGPQLKTAFEDIVTISISTDSIISTDDKVRVSLEFIDPKNGEHFQANCGARHYGAHSIGFDKKNIRLYFDKEYGPNNLNQEIFELPQFGVQPVNSFDKLDLRSSHDSWLWNPTGYAEVWKSPTYITTKLLDDLMLKGGAISPHSRYAHVYLNGVYWGQYLIREKFDDNLMAEYAGGDDSEYDYISGSKGGGSIFHPVNGVLSGGTGAQWNALVNSTSHYDVWKSQINESSFFDMMTIFMYGFVEAEWNAAGAPDNGKEFEFQINDADLFFSRGFLNQTNRTNPYHNANGPENMFLNLYKAGDPRFFTDFADRVALHLTEDGMLTENTLNAHWLDNAMLIDTSIIAECARWGDDPTENPTTWLDTILSYTTHFTPYRADIVLNQLRDEGLYPQVDPVQFSVPTGLVSSNSTVTLSNPNSEGDLYWTSNNEDPSLPDGSINPNANLYNGPISIPAGVTKLKARIHRLKTTVPFIDLAINKPITSSGAQAGRSESYANDGIIRGMYVDSTIAFITSKPSPWIEIDLGSIQQIDRVIAWNRSIAGFLNNFEDTYAFISASPFSSTLVADLLVDPAVDAYQVPGFGGDKMLFEANSQGRYVRIQVPKSAYMMLSEIQVLQRDEDNAVTKNEWSASIPKTYYTSQNYSDLAINEIHYNPLDQVYLDPLTNLPDTVSGRHFEFIEIKNSGSTTIHLQDVRFAKGISYTFTDCEMIQPDQFIVLADDAYWFEQHYGFAPDGTYTGKLDNSGENLWMVDPFGSIIDSLRYNDKAPWPGTADKGYYSLALKEATTDNAIPANWSIQSVFTTPRAENHFTNFGAHSFSGVVINEIHYNPKDSIDTSVSPPDTISGRKFEFVEIKNISAAVINLSDVIFSRGIDYAFPPGTMIAPGAFIVLAEDKSSFQDRYGFPAFDKYDGQLDNGGETLWLSKTNGVLLDAVDYDDSFPWDAQADGGAVDYSLALIDGSVHNNTRLNWRIQCTSLYTPGSENDFNCFSGYDYTGLTINEIFYGPSAGSNYEFIEITNHSNVPMDLEGVSLSTGIFHFFESQYLPGQTAAPNNSLVIARDSTSFHNTYGFAPDGTYVGVLSNSGETLVLQDLFGEIIDEVTYDDVFPWDPLADQGAKSLALISGELDNSQPSSWCTQNVNVTPKAMNTFSDRDNDTVLDCQDQCPGQDDDDVGKACDDGDPCTIGEAFDAVCQCTGGVFQDADNDGVCNLNDQCPGSDDREDTDGDGIPDGCESCIDEVLVLSHQLIVSDTSANLRIKTNGVVTYGNNINYHAAHSIDLLAGFEVQIGAVFHAYMSPCE